MIESTAESIDKPTAIVWPCLMLTAALLLVFPVFAYFGYSRHAMNGVAAAGVAGTVCWLGGLASLLMIGMFRGQAAINATLLGMVFRTGLPLVVGVTLSELGGTLAQAGVFGMILGYYLVALVIDTLLSVRLVGSAKQSFGKAS